MSKKILLVLIFMFFVLATNYVFGSQNVDVFSVSDGYFYCDIYAPTQAKTGQDFTVTFLIRPITTLNVARIRIEVHGNIAYNGEWSTWNYTWESMTMYFGADYRAEHTFSVSSIPTSFGGVGGVYGIVDAAFDVGGQRHTTYTTFEITKIYAKTYQEWEEDYNSLNLTCQNLQNENTSLKNNINSLSLYQNLSISFAVIIIVLFSTTLYLATRKPKSR